MSKSFRTAYDGRNREVSFSTSLNFTGDPGRAQQQFKDECDVNNVIARYKVQGLARVRSDYARGEFMNLASAPDLHTALNIVAAANETFAALPASLRKEYDNDPAKFVEAVHDSKSRETFEKLGLMKPKASDPLPIKVKVVPDEPSAEQTLRNEMERLEKLVRSSRTSSRPSEGV
jgi:phage internal scaffolding protein